MRSSPTPVEGVIYNPTHGFWVALGANAAIMPFVNWLVVFGEHLAYTLITGFIGYIGAGRYYGLDALVEKIQVVRQAPQLRYVLG